MGVLSLSDGWMKVAWSDLKRNFFAERPKDVDGVANASALYYREFLLKKIFSVFEFTIPETWSMDYFQTHLFLDGYIGIVDTDAGVLPLQCSFSGINVFNEPTDIIVANPVLGSFDRKIGVNGVLLRIQYNYMGVLTMLNRYATLLAMCDSGIAVNLMNSKVTWIGMAETKAQAETMKTMYDRISMGEPAVFVKGSAIGNGESIYWNHAKDNYVANEIQDTKRSLIAEFLTEIGIDNVNIDKRERLVTDEVNANDEEIRCNVQHWLENIQTGFREANDLFGLDLSVRIRSYEKINREESGTDESAEFD